MFFFVFCIQVDSDVHGCKTWWTLAVYLIRTRNLQFDYWLLVASVIWAAFCVIFWFVAFGNFFVRDNFDISCSILVRLVFSSDSVGEGVQTGGGLGPQDCHWFCPCITAQNEFIWMFLKKFHFIWCVFLTWRIVLYLELQTNHPVMHWSCRPFHVRPLPQRCHICNLLLNFCEGFGFETNN